MIVLSAIVLCATLLGGSLAGALMLSAILLPLFVIVTVPIVLVLLIRRLSRSPSHAEDTSAGEVDEVLARLDRRIAALEQRRHGSTSRPARSPGRALQLVP